MANPELKPDEKNVLKIPQYSKEEFSVMSEYYIKTGIGRTELSARTRDYIYYLNEGLPGPLLSYMMTYT